MTKEIRIKDVKIGNKNKLVLIAGPCVIENERHAVDHAKTIKAICENLAESVGNLLVKGQIQGKTVTLKVKYFDFTTITRSITLEEPVRGPAVIKEQLPGLLEKTEAGNKKIRLLGITVSNFLGGEEERDTDEDTKQMRLKI